MCIRDSVPAAWDGWDVDADCMEKLRPDGVLQSRMVAADEMCIRDSYNFPKDMRRYLDDRAARLLHAMALRDGLADDTLPALAPWYGIAEHSAFLGGKVTFGEDTSWQDPVLELSLIHI